MFQRLGNSGPGGAVQAALGNAVGENEVRKLEEDILAERMWDRIHLLRAAVTRTALPRITLLGRENLEQAVSRGRGVVLWIDAGAHASTVAKRALHEAGFQVSHLSRPTHTSPSRYGVKFLNRWRMSIEDRFIAQRIMIPPEGMIGAMRQLMNVLRGNGIISLTAGDEASKSELMPFLNAQIQVAPGAIRLAKSAGAALIPLAAKRLENGDFEVALGKPLSLDSGHAAQEYVAGLERRVLACPQQWHGWRTVRPVGVAAPGAEG